MYMGEDLAELDHESIFDNVDNEIYNQYADLVDDQLPYATTIKKVGGVVNFQRLCAWMTSTTKTGEDLFREASTIRTVINCSSFTRNSCLNDSPMFWNFLKTSEYFQRSPWYFRVYIAEKLMGNHVNVQDILFEKEKDSHVHQNLMTSIQVIHKNETYWLNNLHTNDTDDIISYFNPTGNKKKLCTKLYNWFRRRVAAYANLLSKLFPAVIVPKLKQADTITTKHSNKRTIHENIVVQNDFEYNLHSNYASRLPTEDLMGRATKTSYGVVLSPSNLQLPCNHTSALPNHYNSSIPTDNINVCADKGSELRSRASSLDSSICHDADNMDTQVIHIHLNSYLIQNLLDEWPDNIKMEILTFLKRANEITQMVDLL